MGVRMVKGWRNNPAWVEHYARVNRSRIENREIIIRNMSVARMNQMEHDVAMKIGFLKTTERMRKT